MVIVESKRNGSGWGLVTGFREMGCNMVSFGD